MVLPKILRHLKNYSHDKAFTTEGKTVEFMQSYLLIILTTVFPPNERMVVPKKQRDDFVSGIINALSCFRKMTSRIRYQLLNPIARIYLDVN